jgi:hypothetical protein
MGSSSYLWGYLDKVVVSCERVVSVGAARGTTVRLGLPRRIEDLPEDLERDRSSEAFAPRSYLLPVRGARKAPEFFSSNPTPLSAIRISWSSTAASISICQFFNVVAPPLFD